jgi:hypothetical protein
MELDGIKFTLENLPEALRISAICMIGIFVVLGVIYLGSLILQKTLPVE